MLDIILKTTIGRDMCNRNLITFAALCYMYVYVVAATPSPTTTPSPSPHIRVEFKRNSRSNNIELLCRNATAGYPSLLANADFWVNSSNNLLNNIVYGNYQGQGPNTSALFTLLPQNEGAYSCGVIDRGIASLNSTKLTAFPTEVPNSTYTYRVEVGGSVTMACPFSKGALSHYYSNQWIKGFSPIDDADPDSDPRYILNSDDLSITIRNSSFADNSSGPGSWFMCRVRVFNPTGNNWEEDSQPIMLIVLNKTLPGKVEAITQTITPTSTPTVSRPESGTNNDIEDNNNKQDMNSHMITLVVIVSVAVSTVLIVIVVIVTIIITVLCNNRRGGDLHGRDSGSQLSSAELGGSSYSRPYSTSSQYHSNPRMNTCNTSSSLYRKTLLTIGDYIPSNDVEFVGSIQVIACDRSGGEYRNGSITIRIPKDAVRDSIELEIGVAIHGPFTFPDDLRPVSAFLWLNVAKETAEDADFEFLNEIEVQLPHYLHLSKSDVRSEASQLGCMLAATRERDSMAFVREDSDRITFSQRSGKILTKRACYMCLCASKSVIETKSQYYLVSAIPKSVSPAPKRWSILFLVCYSLDSFTDMIREQIGHSYEITTTKFVFDSTRPQEEARITMQFTPTQSAARGWLLTVPADTTEIPVSRVELWEDDVSDLQLRCQHKLYPPRVAVEVAANEARQNSHEVFTFSGALFIDRNSKQKFATQVALIVPAAS